MNIDWTKIKNGFNGFEKLAVRFVKEVEPRKNCAWKHTKDTRDKNHDAIMAKEIEIDNNRDFSVFVGYTDSVDVWWMEAKYSDTKSNNKVISRYRLDATIVSAILSKNISKIIFVTNLEVSAKTICDIRNALIFSGGCKEVKFYTKYHIECWLLGKTYSFYRRWFTCSLNEYNKLEKPLYNCIEELSIYTHGNNFFQEALNSVYTNQIYEIHFSISVQKDFIAKLKNSVNIKLLSNEAQILELKKGVNQYTFNAQIPKELKFESISDKDAKGEYKAIMPLSISYILKDSRNADIANLQLISSTAIRIINSTYVSLEIISQKKVVQQLYNEFRRYTNSLEREFSLINVYGKSGIGKSYTLQLFKNKLIEEKQQILCNSYNFSGDDLCDIQVLKKFIFNLFFPYLFLEDLDEAYVSELQQRFPHFGNTFWDFVFFSTEIEDIIKYTQNIQLLEKIFPRNMGINNRTIIFDDIHKLSSEYFYILRKIFEIFIRYEYPVFLIISSQKKLPLEEYRIGKTQYLNQLELCITDSDISNLLNQEYDFLDLPNIIPLFGSVIEVVYFTKYLATLNDSIKNIDEFRLAYNSFKSCELLKNEIISKFKNTFKKINGAEELCSCIYYTLSGIHKDLIYNSPESTQIIDVLLDAELIKKNDIDYFVCWHDYYKEIFMNTFSLKTYNNLHIPFEDVYNIRLKLEISEAKDEIIEEIIKSIADLFTQQKYYSIYYILENIFLNNSIKEHFKNRISIHNYFLLFGYFAYANTNAGTNCAGGKIFKQIYTETTGISKSTVMIIRYIMLWELINSLYENENYEEALEKIEYFEQMPRSIETCWKPLFDWDLYSLKYAVNTVKMFIDSENGINNLCRVPSKEFLFHKDIAFSTYRLLLCNFTNDFKNAERILREYNTLIQENSTFDKKTQYMYNFTVTFLDCINNDIDISEVISANNLLKNNFINDYNRHIFIIALLALMKKDINLCKQYKLEYIKTNRPMKKRQYAFSNAYSAILALYNKQKERALVQLNKELELFEQKKTYSQIIKHNIEYINNIEFTLENLEFYFGNPLENNKYYIDIRMLY